jgi:hypothetical protein
MQGVRLVGSVGVTHVCITLTEMLIHWDFPYFVGLYVRLLQI